MQPTPMHQSIHRPINPVAKMICQGGVKPWATSCRNLGENIAECLGNFIGMRKRLSRHWPSRFGPKQVCHRAAPHDLQAGLLGADGRHAIRSRGGPSNTSALAMVFKLVEGSHSVAKGDSCC